MLCTLKSRWDDSHGHWSFDMQLLMQLRIRSLYELAALAELFNVNGDQDETSDESHVSPPFHFYTYQLCLFVLSKLSVPTMSTPLIRQ